MYNDPNQPPSPYGQPPSPYGQPPSPYGQPQQPPSSYEPVPTVYGQPQQPPPPPYEPVPTMYAPQQVSPPFGTPPVQRRNRRGLWITLSAIIGVLVVGSAIVVVIVLNLPNVTKVLNTYCNALKAGDYQGAYNQYTSDAQKDLGAETDFATYYRSFGNVTNCTVSNVDDGQHKAMLTLTFPNGLSLVYDTQAVSDKINYEKLHSTPSTTLSTFCAALKTQSYQTAYNQLSSTVQGQVGSADTLATAFSTVQVTDCTVSNVDDTAGTGTITYTMSDGTTVTADYTLATESGVWKISTQKTR